MSDDHQDRMPRWKMLWVVSYLVASTFAVFAVFAAAIELGLGVVGVTIVPGLRWRSALQIGVALFVVSTALVPLRLVLGGYLEVNENV